MDATHAGVLTNCFPAVCVGRMETNNGKKRGDHKKLCTLTNNADLPHPGNYFVQQQNRIGFFLKSSEPVADTQSNGFNSCITWKSPMPVSVLCWTSELKDAGVSPVIKKGQKLQIEEFRAKAGRGNHFPGVSEHSQAQGMGRNSHCRAWASLAAPSQPSHSWIDLPNKAQWSVLSQDHQSQPRAALPPSWALPVLLFSCSQEQLQDVLAPLGAQK